LEPFCQHAKICNAFGLSTRERPSVITTVCGRNGTQNAQHLSQSGNKIRRHSAQSLVLLKSRKPLHRQRLRAKRGKYIIVATYRVAQAANFPIDLLE